MRIALVSQKYPPDSVGGGICTQTYLKAHGLASLGHEVHVLSHSPDSKKHEYKDSRVHVTRIPGFDNQFPIYSEPVRWLTYSTLVASELSERHFRTPLDIIDFPEWGGEGYIYLLNRTEWNFIPSVVQVHGPLVMLAHTIGWPEKGSHFFRIGTEMEGTCLKLADAVFSSGKCGAEWCARCYGIPAKQIPILHSGVDTNLFHPLAAPKESGPTIISVGKLVENKGVGLLLAAALDLTHEFQGLKLRLVGWGDPGFIQRLHDRTTSRGFPYLLDTPGFIPQKELPQLLNRAHLFAAPSQYEGGPGLVYLEAMACGLPVIACEGSGAADVVTHKKTGILVPPNNLRSLKEALRSLLNSPGEREMLGKQARAYVLAKADTRKCIRKIETLYRDVARRSKKNSGEE